MRDRELYGKILGIEAPWVVEDVELDRESEEVRVHLRNSRSHLPCPACGQSCRCYDARCRRWSHLDTCQYRTILVAEVPRVRCPEHGVLQVTVPWAEAGSGFTALYEALPGVGMRIVRPKYARTDPGPTELRGNAPALRW